MDNLNLDEAKDKILEAITKQRWFFFENKPKVLMDKLTGILWANLDYFPYINENTYSGLYSEKAAKILLSGLIIDDFYGWDFPTYEEFINIAKDETFPFHEGNNYRIKGYCSWIVKDGYSINLDNGTMSYSPPTKFIGQLEASNSIGYLLPCNRNLIIISNYPQKMLNKSYTKKEKNNFTLDLFAKNNLIPIFKNKKIMELYKKIYIEKSFVLSIIVKKSIQTVIPLNFDYKELLSKYDLATIDKSVIKYYQSVSQWLNELLDNLDGFEQQKQNIINEFNNITLKLSSQLNNNGLSVEENNLLQKRQRFLQGKLSLDMSVVKRRLLAIKEQAEAVEDRIELINGSENFFKDLAQLEKEDRPSFALVAEDTANILMNALQRINYIETNRRFATVAVDIWEQWTEDYKIFKTKDKEELKNSAEQDGIDESIWQGWYADWQKLRFTIEEKIQPALARGLKGDIPIEKENEITVIEQLIRCLEMYKEDIDKFYLEERKSIYQKYAFAPGGDLQDKFEAEGELYKRTAKFQSDLQEIIFSCTKTADRMFILKWAENLLDIQIDEIIAFVADKDLQQISREVLQSFSALKQKNYDAYLNDAKAYGQEKANREKQYNSLMFKMRNELNKQK